LYVIDEKWGYRNEAGAAQKKGELKNDGKSHDVYENKGRADGQIGKSHDVDENKWLNFNRPRYV
jgi:hypothetical protein